MMSHRETTIPWKNYLEEEPAMISGHKTNLKLNSLVIACGVAILSASPTYAGKGGNKPCSAAYQVVTLAPAGVDVWRSGVGDLNEVGNAVGYYEDLDGGFHAFHYNRTSNSFTPLNGGTSASGLNNSEQVVGLDESGAFRVGLYWHTANGVPVVVPPLPGDWECVPSDINDDGVISGTSTGPGGSRAVVWQVQVGESVSISNPIDLGVLAGDDHSGAARLNELSSQGRATVAGHSDYENVIGYDGNGSPINETWSRAVTWEVQVGQDGSLSLVSGPSDLGTSSGELSDALAVNNFDDVCGTHENWPFLQISGETMEPLEGVRNAIGGKASDVNDLQETVGTLQVSDKRGIQFEFRAFLWRNGSPIDLTKQIRGGTDWQLLEHALEVSNSGHIAGVGWNSQFGSGNGAYLLIPSAP
jgi:hypothetical protein